jgi:hypothetical protein
MKIEVKVDRAIDLADGATRTYGLLERKLSWRSPDPKENEKNKSPSVVA